MKERLGRLSLLDTHNVFVVLFVLNLLQYIDRGIIPGSTNQFSALVVLSLGTDSPDVYIGLLQSSFIIGFATASLIFARLVHYYSPFYLALVGMSIWCVAVLASGIAVALDSYVLLILARCLSGVGESSLQCSIPPWIESKAGPGSKGSWLGLFYSAIPVGTAFGYTYSSLMSECCGAKYAFILEAFLMAPFLLFLALAAVRYPDIASSAAADGNIKTSISINSSGGDEGSLNTHAVAPMSLSASDSISSSSSSSSLDPHFAAPTLTEEVVLVFSSPVYVCIVLGYAAQTGSLIGLGTFGSPILQGIGYFDSQTEASTIFGILVSVSGVIGSLGGGIILDARAKKATSAYLTAQALVRGEESSETDHSDADKAAIGALYLVQACGLIFGCSVCGAIALWSVFLIRDEVLFLLITALGCTFVFLTTPCINLAVMQAVPLQSRSFAIAVCNLLIHALGDVPSPVLAGLLKDRLAPDCAGVDAASDQCRADSQGLRWVFFLITLWLVWTVLFNGLAFCLAVGGVRRMVDVDSRIIYATLSMSSSHNEVLNEPLLPKELFLEEAPPAEEGGSEQPTFSL
jgi:MFS family permease